MFSKSYFPGGYFPGGYFPTADFIFTEAEEERIREIVEEVIMDASTLSAIAAAVRDVAVEGSMTLGQLAHLAAAGVASKTSGMDGTSPKIRSLADDRDLVAGTVDANGNRTSITLDL